MKSLKMTLALIAALALNSCTKKAKDLGELTYQRPSGSNAYCVYEITKVLEQPDAAGYSVGDKFCIKCCTSGDDQWPGGNGNCPSPIQFETQDGAEYEASLENGTNNTCITCPTEITDGYNCP